MRLTEITLEELAIGVGPVGLVELNGRAVVEFCSEGLNLHELYVAAWNKANPRERTEKLITRDAIKRFWAGEMGLALLAGIFDAAEKELCRLDHQDYFRKERDELLEAEREYFAEQRADIRRELKVVS